MVIDLLNPKCGKVFMSYLDLLYLDFSLSHVCINIYKFLLGIFFTFKILYILFISWDIWLV